MDCTYNNPDGNIAIVSPLDLASAQQVIGPGDDVRSVAHAVLRHRLILSYDALADRVSSDDVIDEIIAQVAVG